MQEGNREGMASAANIPCRKINEVHPGADWVRENQPDTAASVMGIEIT